MIYQPHLFPGQEKSLEVPVVEVMISGAQYSHKMHQNDDPLVMVVARNHHQKNVQMQPPGNYPYRIKSLRVPKLWNQKLSKSGKFQGDL